MKKSILLASLCSLALSHGASASTPTVLTFDDLQPGSITSDYGGLTGWDFLGSIHDWSWAGGDHVFQGSRGTLAFTQGPVVFQGLDYVGWNGDLTPGGIALYFQGIEVYRSDIPTPYDQQFNLQWFASGYSGLVDQIEFYAPLGGDGFAMDNLTFTAAVPEPETYGMLLAGLVTTGWMVGRRRRQEG